MSSHKIAVRIVTLSLAALILAGCGGAEGRKAKYLERGKNYLKEEKYEKAAVELKNVLQIDPKHAEAYFLLAQIEEQKRNFRLCVPRVIPPSCGFACIWYGGQYP